MPGDKVEQRDKGDDRLLGEIGGDRHLERMRIKVGEVEHIENRDSEPDQHHDRHEHWPHGADLEARILEVGLVHRVKQLDPHKQNNQIADKVEKTPAPS
jgi:hypothetical protein